MAVSAVSSGFDVTFAEQIGFFRQKLNLGTQRWDDIHHEAHDRSFVVAGAMKADLLNDLRQAIDKAIASGTSLETFRREFREIVARNGWTGWTGEGSEAGIAWRTRVIYETNLRSSYAAGRYVQLTDPELLARRPYWRYMHSDAVLHPRPHHQAWGAARLTLRYDHDFWKTHFPPNGWGCHCWVVAVVVPGEQDLTEPPDSWDVPDSRGRLPGIDMGWAYAPGRSIAKELRQMVLSKLEKLPDDLGEAFFHDTRPVLDKYVDQKTSKAASAWVMKHDMVDHADYSGVHVDVANAFNHSLFDHITEFPALRKNQEFIGSAQAQFKRYTTMVREAYANALVSRGLPRDDAERWAEKTFKTMRVDPMSLAQSWNQAGVKGIAVNAKYGKRPEEMLAIIRRDAISEWHPPACSTIRSYADHEFGHQLDNLLGLDVDKDIIQVYEEARRKGIRNEVSGYAAEHIKEFIAECWAEASNSVRPRPAARVVAAIIRSRYRSKFGNAS